jgi:hypothetical protein
MSSLMLEGEGGSPSHSPLPPLVDALEEEEVEARGARGTDPFTKKSCDSFINFHVSPWKHATYAGTWYALSLIGSYLCYLRFRRPRPRSFPPSS